MAKNNNPGKILKGTKATATLKGASGIWTLDEAMQLHRANAWPQPNLFQPVANSLRTKNYGGSSAGSYGLRFGGRASTPTQATFSGWIKRGNNSVSSDYWIFGSNQYITSTTIPPVLEVIIKGNNGGASDHSLTVAVENASLSYYTSTSALFRDMSAWYHIHVAYDSTQATNTNRIKIWINGVQLTAMSGSSWPTRGYAIGTQTPSLGCLYLNGAPTRFFDGQMAEMNFIDGYALQPTLFGQYDTNNTWVPVAYTGSYGTNGFYLPFVNTATSQTLGYDASLNGTATYDADQDPYRGSVALHLTGNGPAGGNNNVFADSSSNNLAITRSGSTTQGSFSPFPLQANTPYNPATHGASAYFGTTTSDNIYAASNSALSIGTSNFTVEFWINWTTWAAEQRFVLMGQSGSSALEISRSTANGNNLLVYTNTSLKITASFTPTIGSWYHIAIVRTGTGAGQLVLYINGVSTATGTSADSISNNNFFVGGLNWGAGYNHIGYISSLRVINGAAVYTAAFTPTMRPFGTLTNNLLNFSEDFANSVWTAQSAVVGLTTNAAIAPDGTPSATLLVPSTSSAGQNIAGLHDSAAGVNTFSIYAKSAGYRYMQCFHSRSAGGDAGYVTFDLTTGTVTNSSVWSGSIVNVGNGWYRIIATTSSLAGASANSNVRWAITDGTASRAPAFTGNGTSGIYVWGAQAELASSAGNYTPTPANFSTAPSLLLNFANSAVVDTSGSGNIVTVSGATITSAAKYGSGALSFNGSSDYFQSSWSLSPFLSPGANNWTLETWVNMTKSLSSAQVIVGYGYESGTTRSFVWYYNGDGTFRLAQSPDGTTNYDAGFGAPQGGFVLNTWYHLAIVRNSGAMTMYVNGKAMPNTLSAYTISSISTGYFRIGVEASTYFGGSMDDLRYTKGVARYTTDFAPPARALPETGGKSFVTSNINAGVVKTFTLSNVNVVGAKIYHVTTAPRSANYTVEYSDDNSTWTTAFGGVMSSMDGTVGIKVGTVTSGGSGTTGTGAWGPHLYWRYVEGSTISGHHPRCSRIIFTDSTGRDFNFRVFAVDNSSDIGDYQLGTRSGVAQGPTVTTSWTAPTDVTSVEVLVVAGGGGGGGKNTGGGGGGGGLIYNNAYPVTPGQTYTVTVGVAGTNAAGYQSYGGNGGNSVFGNLTAIAGGGGGYGVQGGTRAVAGRVGGSGGGGGGDDTGGSFAGGTGTAGQGFNGGQGTSPGANAGGGGGAGAVGGDSVVSTRGGNGAAGLAFGISGSPTFYAGGGGGGGNGTAGTGGTGGGGAGAAGNPPATATSGTPHTGGGGGGCGGYETGFTAGTGGSGIVLIRYTTAAVGNTSDATTDNLVDSPTQYGHDSGAGGEVVGNYATWNPLIPAGTGVASTFSNGNLTVTNTSASGGNGASSFGTASGKWYYEAQAYGMNSASHLIGILGSNTSLVAAQNFGNVRSGNIGWYDLAGSSTSSNTWTAEGTIINIAYDVDAGKCWFGINGLWLKNGNPAEGTAPAFTFTIGTNVRPWFAFDNAVGNKVFHANFGQRAWAYAPPAGYNALTTKNLPRLTNAAAIAPNQYFDAVTYTGTVSAQTIALPGAFQPDLVWFKNRGVSQNHHLMDVNRGGGTLLYANLVNSEDALGTSWANFTSTGFSLGASVGVNTSTNTYVAWCWRAGGAPVSNGDGNIASQVSVNAASGFSVVSYTGSNVQSTIGHGLSTAPGFILIKSRTNGTRNWAVYHSSFSAGEFMYLNSIGGKASDNSAWGPVTSTTFQLGNGVTPNTSWNESGNTFIAYCWAEVAGFSKFGSYRGNGSTDGPFVYLGFTPRFVMVKKTDSSDQDWYIWDTARSSSGGNNALDLKLYPNQAYIENGGAGGGESTSTNNIDAVSNGFKLRTGNAATNASNANFIYMAFAGKPFGNANGTAR